jgi:hypothetical protein
MRAMKELTNLKEKVLEMSASSWAVSVRWFSRMVKMNAT